MGQLQWGRTRQPYLFLAPPAVRQAGLGGRQAGSGKQELAVLAALAVQAAVARGQAGALASGQRGP